VVVAGVVVMMVTLDTRPNLAEVAEVLEMVATLVKPEGLLYLEQAAVEAVAQVET
jgi:hypothetical protein